MEVPIEVGGPTSGNTPSCTNDISVIMSWPWSEAHVPRPGKRNEAQHEPPSTTTPSRPAGRAGGLPSRGLRAAFGPPTALRPAVAGPPRERLPRTEDAPRGSSGSGRPAGRSRRADVDLVVALVHARRLDVVGRRGPAAGG